MSIVPIPVRACVFLSYSSHDGDDALQLACSLEEAGIPVWVDFRQLTPGTPDWEDAIRRGIGQSCAVVLLASPAASASRFVRAEIALAESSRCQIYPVWIRGDHWVDSVPLGLASMQCIDLRETDRTQGVRTLTKLLAEQIAETSPIHYVGPARRGEEFCYKPVITPRGYVAVELPLRESSSHGDTAEAVGRAAFFRMSAFHSLSELLDLLFIEYLANDFPPYTYGIEWVLQRRSWHCPQVLADFAWLLKWGQPTQDRYSYLQSSLSELGVTDRLGWRVAVVGSLIPTGVALWEPRILESLDSSSKVLPGLKNEGVLIETSVDAIDPSLAHRFVVANDNYLMRKFDRITALAQAKRELPEWLNVRYKRPVGTPP